MLTEDYVSFEIAKLLKEKGFNEKCSRWYVANESQEGVIEKGFDENQFYISAPTIQMVMKWLREEYDLHCHIDCPLLFYQWRYAIRDLSKDEWVVNKYNDDKDTYEEACEAAIKYSLEYLI